MRHRRRRLSSSRSADDICDSLGSPCESFSARATLTCSLELLRWLHALERTNLAFAFELRPMNAVQVHEARCQGKGFIVGLRLDNRITADHFFRLDEWTVDHA